MEEYGIMEYLELVVTRCGRWTENREFIWSGLMADPGWGIWGKCPQGRIQELARGGAQTG